MATTMSIDEVLEKIKGLMGAQESVTVNKADEAELTAAVTPPRMRTELAKTHKIVTDTDTDTVTFTSVDAAALGAPSTTGTTTSTELPAQTRRKARPERKGSRHTYIPPKFAEDFMNVLLSDMPLVTWIVGPTQCGKTSVVDYVSGKLGRRVFRVGCRGDMVSEQFFGSKSAENDGGVGVTGFVPGMVEQSMTEGLDDDGNEVGEPGILFIDEAAALPPHVGIGLNPVLESDDPIRKMVLANDGGREVRSHSGWRIVMAANTIGRGAENAAQALYAAQVRSADISTLQRVGVTFRMGYDKKVERRIMMELFNGNDPLVEQFGMFRDQVRQGLKNDELTTPFSTASVIQVCKLYRIFGDIGKAIYNSLYFKVLEDERLAYNEAAKQHIYKAGTTVGIDILAENADDPDIDYM